MKEFISVGMLTGRPEEEMPAYAGDLLQDLTQLHERARQVMQGIAQALWPSTSLPKCMGELMDMLQGESLPTRCKRSLGHGEDPLYQA